ncbi:MAG: hypothetical protein ACJ76O_12250 [Gaiellaceae bacterium]
MKTLEEIHAELDTASERRSELWQLLSKGHDSELSQELHELEERIASLWDEHRALRAQQRFGNRDEIIKRARHEERLARAA